MIYHITYLQVTKRLSDGFSGLWTMMGGPYLRAQALTFTKSHLERQGPFRAVANSLRLYGYEYPDEFFSDVPDKVCNPHRVYFLRC